MISDGRRDHMEVDMTPLAGMTSSSVIYLRVLLLQSSIQSPSKSVMLQITGEKKQRNMIAQITLRGALKVWKLVHL